MIKCRIAGLSIGYNGLALGEEADFEELNCLPALNWIQNTKLHLSTEPAFCQTLVMPSFSFFRHICSRNIWFSSSDLLRVIKCPPFLIVVLHFTKLKGKILSLVPWI